MLTTLTNTVGNSSFVIFKYNIFESLMMIMLIVSRKYRYLLHIFRCELEKRNISHNMYSVIKKGRNKRSLGDFDYLIWVFVEIVSSHLLFVLLLPTMRHRCPVSSECIDSFLFLFFFGLQHCAALTHKVNIK